MNIWNELKYGLVRLLNRRLVATKNSKIHPKARMGNGAQIVDSCIDRYTYVYESTVIRTEMGAFCSVAAGTIVGGASHPTQHISTSPLFTNGRNVFNKNFSNNKAVFYKTTKIGNDVWIGSRCLLKGGVAIGDGAIIGMGSIVTKDIPPYEIWAGNPAKFIRKRFDDETIEKLQKLQWWNWDEDKLRKYGNFFDDPQKLFEQLEAEK